MKLFHLLLGKVTLFLSISLFMFSCGDDDSNPNPDTGNNNSDIIIKEFTFQGDANSDRIEIVNNGTSTVDISSWFFCPAIGVYPAVSSLTVESGSTTIPANGSVILSGLDLGNTEGALALYTSNTFTDMNAIIQFVQWGSNVGNDREDIAVSAGLWTSGTFIDISGIQAGNSLEFDGDGISVSDWVIQTSPTLGDMGSPELQKDVYIKEFSFQGTASADRFEIYNSTSAMVDISGYYLCNTTGSYPAITSLTVESGSLMIPAGGAVVLSGADLGNASGTLALYANNSGFGNDANIVDFVQWGADVSSDRETVAVSAGLWESGTFIDISGMMSGNSLEYDGDGISVSDWAIQTSPTL